MRLRRIVAVAGVTLVCAPVVLRAQDDELPRSEAEAMAYDDELRIDAVGHGGLGHYTSCDGDHAIAYGGMSGAARWRMAHGPTWRAAGGVVYTRDEITRDAEPPRVETSALGGGVFQVGEDFTWWGFLVGVSVFTDGSTDQSDTPILPAAELRIGPLRPFYVRLAFGDEPLFLRYLIAAEAVFANPEYLLAPGVRLAPGFDAPILAMRGEVALGKEVSLGAGLGVAPTERHLSWQAELSLGIRMDP